MSDATAVVYFRVSAEEHRRLVEEARTLGLTVQALMEHRALGYVKGTRRGPKKRRVGSQSEELPLTG